MHQILLTRLGVTVDICRSMVYSHKNKPTHYNKYKNNV